MQRACLTVYDGEIPNSTGGVLELISYFGIHAVAGAARYQRAAPWHPCLMSESRVACSLRNGHVAWGAALEPLAPKLVRAATALFQHDGHFMTASSHEPRATGAESAPSLQITYGAGARIEGPRWVRCCPYHCWRCRAFPRYVSDLDQSCMAALNARSADQENS
jgi:hypothetical protein